MPTNPDHHRIARRTPDGPVATGLDILAMNARIAVASLFYLAFFPFAAACVLTFVVLCLACLLIDTTTGWVAGCTRAWRGEPRDGWGYDDSYDLGGRE